MAPDNDEELDGASASEVVEEFTIALQKRSASDRLGVEVAYESTVIRVIGLAEDGMVSHWNASNPGAEVMKGDCILAVGGVRVARENFKEELSRASGKLELLPERTTTVIERPTAQESDEADGAGRAPETQGVPVAASNGRRLRSQGLGPEPPDWLPEGWTMELKAYPSQTQKHYVSPDGITARSKLEVLRIVEEQQAARVVKKERETRRGRRSAASQFGGVISDGEDYEEPRAVRRRPACAEVPPEAPAAKRRARSQPEEPPSCQSEAAQPRGSTPSSLQQGGSAASTGPRSSARVGRAPPPASVAELLAFLQCQLCMEAKQVLGERIELQDSAAKALWGDYEAHAGQLLGRERWVPFHASLEANSFFLIHSVLHCKAAVLDERRKFLQIFIFGAHCRQEVFMKVQRPHLMKAEFWENPLAAFQPGGDMEKDLLSYRTGRLPHPPLFKQTVLGHGRTPEDDSGKIRDPDKRLVSSLLKRTICLLKAAEEVWPILSNGTKRSVEKREEVTRILDRLSVHGSKTCPESLIRHLFSFLDIAFPKVGLLRERLEVDAAAQDMLSALVPGEGEGQDQLKELTLKVNRHGGHSAECFWSALARAEALAREKFGAAPLVLAHMGTTRGHLPAATLHTQLCEYHQFRQGRRAPSPAEPTRSQRGSDELPRARVAGSPIYDEASDSMRFELGGVSYSVSAEEASGSLLLAERVAALCALKFGEGATRKEVDEFREDLLRQCARVDKVNEAPFDSDAWPVCQANYCSGELVVNFMVHVKVPGRGRGRGATEKVGFRTSASAAGGVIEAERVARLCYLKFKEGAERSDVQAFRTRLYKHIEEAGKKRKRGSG